MIEKFEVCNFGLVEALNDYPVWCGFDELKHPFGLDNKKGISVDTPRDRLGTYEQAKSLGYPYVGLSFTNTIKVGDQILICLDFDWKRSPSRSPEPEQIKLMQDLDALGVASETSHSGLGAHYWVLVNQDNVPSRVKLKNQCEIEVFSGLPSQSGNVLVTDHDAIGSLLFVDLSSCLPVHQAVASTIKSEPARVDQTEHGKSELIRALKYISPFDYGVWIKVGMALRYELGDAGFEIWDEWSSNDEKYDPSEMAYKWNSFAGGGMKAGSIIYYAQQNGFVYNHPRVSANDEFSVYVDPETGEFVQPPKLDSGFWPERVVQPTDYMVATDWVIDDLVSEKLTIIAGAPGVGKTTCLFGIFATAAGFKDSENPLKATFRRKILWVSEHPEQIQQLMEAISKKYVDSRGEPLYTKNEINEWIVVVEAFRANQTQLASLGHFAMDYVVYDGDGGAVEPLVVLDTANACLDLEDENKNSEVGKYVSVIKEQLIKRHIPVVLIAHTPKAVQRKDVSSLSARGAGAFEGDAHATGFVFQDTEIGARLFKLAKRRYRVANDELTFKSDSLLTTAIDRRGKVAIAEVDIALPRLFSDSARAEMSLKANQAKAQQEEVAKVKYLQGKAVELWGWLIHQVDMSINQIQNARLSGLTDKKLIRSVLEMMQEHGMATSYEGKRGGQKTVLYVANKEWGGFKHPE